MSPELIAKIKRIASSIFAVALVIVGAWKPDWLPSWQAVVGDVTIALDSILNAIAGVLLLFSSGNLAVKNVL